MENKILIKGVPLNLFKTESEAVSWFKTMLNKNSGGYSVAINAEKLIRCFEDNQFLEIVKEASIHVPDGIFPIILARFKGYNSIRINFPQLILENSNELECKMAIVGSTEENLAFAVHNIKREYPRIQIVYATHGYRSFNEVYNDLSRIEKPHILMIGMGSPIQEQWTSKLTSVLPRTFITNVGGALDIISGAKIRAPHYVQKMGLEWLYRLVREPRRIRRQFRIMRIFKYLFK